MRIERLMIVASLILILLSVETWGANNDIIQSNNIHGTNVRIKRVELEYLDKDISDAELWRSIYIKHLTMDTVALAQFLLSMDELDRFVESCPDSDYDFITAWYASRVFDNNRQIHRKALEKAKEILDGIQIEIADDGDFSKEPTTK